MDSERFKQLAEFFIKTLRFGMGITEEIPKKPDCVEWSDLYKLSKNHSLTAITRQAIKKGGFTPDAEVWEKMEKHYRFLLRADTEQLFAWEELKELAKTHDFVILPMKGINIKMTYPCSSLRQMGDIDVLYKREDFKKIKKALESVGYEYDTSSSESNHQVFKRPPVMDIEMHRDLFSDENPFYEYYKDPFAFAKPTEEENVYAFSLEDEYVYSVLHAGKHYFSYGSGVRTFLDEYVFLTRYQDTLDFEYIEKEFQKADEIARKHGGENSIVEFEKQARALANGWFAGEEICLNETALYVLSGGVYGVLERGWEKAHEREGKKYVWRRLFPSYKMMCKRNPILKKLPFLLPFFWVGRLFKGLFDKKSRQEYRYIKSREKNKKNVKKA